MSSTTQILFNSPALHSLKRDQLVKLCKIHSIKASGKNVDLIDKLKQHAVTLPKDDPLSIAVRGESNEHEDEGSDEEEEEREEEESRKSRSASPVDHQPASSSRQPPRMSWEVVMHSIAEEDEHETIKSTRSTSNHKGAGEFGTGASSRSIGSSIKSLATSLGKLTKSHKSPKSIKSASTNVPASSSSDAEELEKTAQRYSSIGASGPPDEQPPLAFNPSRMEVDGFLADGESPLPGHALRPGVPAPPNARLSLGLGLGGPPATPSQPTTTIRLVANRPNQDQPENPATSHRPPFETPRLKPFATSFDLVMGSPAPAGSLYPTLTVEDLPPTLSSVSPSRNVPVQPSFASVMMMDVDEPMESTPTKGTGILSVPDDDPFIFGSPLPKHRVSDVQFKSAAASVLEEMNRRLQEEGVEGVDSTLIERLHPGATKPSTSPPRDTKPLPKTRAAVEVQKKFNDAHKQEFARMEGIDSYVKRKAAGLAPQNPQNDTNSRRTSVVVGKKRKSSVVEGPPRPIGAPRPGGTRVVSNGRRPPVKAKTVIPGAFGMDGDDEEEEKEDERAGKRIRISTEGNAAAGSSSKVEEKEEDEAKKEEKRAAIKRKLELNKARRRSSAAAGVAPGGRRSVGRQSIAKPPPKSRFGFLSSAKSLVQSVWGRAKPAAAPASTTKPHPPKTTGFLKKSAPTPAPPTFTPASAKPTTHGSTLTKPTAASSARSKSPVPSNTGVTPAQSIRSSLALSKGTAQSRAGVSSIGTRASMAKGAAGTVGSMGVRNTRTSGGSVAEMGTHAPGTARGSMAPSRVSSTSSRLFAPTASSLAKMSSGSMRHASGSGIPVRSPAPSSAGHSRNNSVTSVAEVVAPAASSPGTGTAAKVGAAAAGGAGAKANGGERALETITNTTARPTPYARIKSPGGFTPARGKIFSQPLQTPRTGHETPRAKQRVSTTAMKGTAENAVGAGSPTELAKMVKSTPVRQRSLNGRKPRVSRSRVIAKLRETKGTGAAAGAGASSSRTSGAAALGSAMGDRRKSTVAGTPRQAKARSSLGAKVVRSSLGPVKTRESALGVLASAKKRARQSEYYNRRQSRVGEMKMQMDVGED